MNVLYLIGNGFDLNLHLRTSYSDFLNEYVKEPSGSEQIATFKQYIAEQKEINNTELWSDLELMLGSSTSKFEKASDFEGVLLDVNKSLRNYILKENERIVYNKTAQDRFQSFLLNPQKYLTNADQLNLSNFAKAYGNTWNINFMSFNYTYSVEKLLGEAIGKELGKNAFGGVSKVSGIKHIHGVCDGTILVGLNDISQIANVKFRENQSLLRKFIKPSANKVIGELVDRDCVNLFQQSNLVCCFGLSFGKTDSYWWDALINNLNGENCRVVIYDYKDGLEITHSKWAIGDGKEDVCTRLFRLNLYTQSHYDRMLYSLNTDMFSGLAACVKEM